MAEDQGLKLQNLEQRTCFLKQILG